MWFHKNYSCDRKTLKRIIRDHSIMDLSRCADFNPSATLSTRPINQNWNSSDKFTSCRKQCPSKIRIFKKNTRYRLQKIFAGQKYFCDWNFFRIFLKFFWNFFETRKEKYWNRANMGFKTGMFKYFNELDEDCSGFLEPDEITGKLSSSR